MKLLRVIDDVLFTYLNKKMCSIFFVGFSCGVPFLLTLSILDIWLKECGVSNTTIGLFTLLHLPFTLKFLWGAFIDKFDFPYLSRKLGRRRGWAIASQILLFCGIVGMAHSSPSDSMGQLMLFASIVAFADGCQEIALYAYQVNKDNRQSDFGPVAGTVLFGFKIGMFFAKSVSLYLAWYFSWSAAYYVMAAAILVATCFILYMKEPVVELSIEGTQIDRAMRWHRLKNNKETFYSAISVAIIECLVLPFKIFIKKDGNSKLLLLIMLYKAGDCMLQKTSKLFYIDIGFSTLEIANVVQVFGSIAALFGGIIGGYIIKKIGIYRSMLVMGAVHSLACFIYIILFNIGHDIYALYLVVFVENVTGGAMSASFLAFLYSICYTGYPATQYALLWAFHEIGGIVFRVSSGAIVDIVGWSNFFVLVFFAFIPGLVTIKFLLKNQIKNAPKSL